jgi:hypothetical protein
MALTREGLAQYLPTNFFARCALATMHGRDLVQGITTAVGMTGLTSFASFATLPVELRLEIWQFFLLLETKRRVVVLSHDKYPRVLPFAHLASPLLSVNRESRKLALEFYSCRVPIYKFLPRLNKHLTPVSSSDTALWAACCNQVERVLSTPMIYLSTTTSSSETTTTSPLLSSSSPEDCEPAGTLYLNLDRDILSFGNYYLHEYGLHSGQGAERPLFANWLRQTAAGQRGRTESRAAGLWRRLRTVLRRQLGSDIFTPARLGGLTLAHFSPPLSRAHCEQARRFSTYNLWDLSLCLSFSFVLTPGTAVRVSHEPAGGAYTIRLGDAEDWYWDWRESALRGLREYYVAHDDRARGKDYFRIQMSRSARTHELYDIRQVSWDDEGTLYESARILFNCHCPLCGDGDTPTRARDA